jgi:cytochrome c553
MKLRQLIVPVPPPRVLLRWTAGASAVLGVGALLFAWSGIYNVAASRDHIGITTAFLELALRSSVRTQSLGIDPPMLDDDQLVALGAAHFHSGCAPCHGSPLASTPPPFENMLPAPPSLSNAAEAWTDAQLFWIVKNGLKFTGMPAWPAIERNDEVWTVVAFLKRYSELDAQEYGELIRTAEGSTNEFALCVRCHGDETTPPSSRFVPRLAGQSRLYLAVSLDHYVAGTRPSGVMEAAAGRLDESAIIRAADYYASIDAADHRSTDADAPAAQIDRGRIIATEGIRSDLIPPCLACHGAEANELFPRLAGQHAPYTAGQLRLWKSGLRDTSVLGAVMAPIARRLSDGQIDEVAAYFESVSPEFPPSGQVRP